MQIILFNPEIPQNTGNIIRTCSVTGTKLFLVEPLGFSLSDRQLKRAGLDYLNGMQIEIISDLEMFLKNESRPFYFFSSKADKPYYQASFTQEDFLIFGSESKGLPSIFSEKYKERFLNIPMLKNKRCLNLATSAGIAIYEALRQQNFRSLN